MNILITGGAGFIGGNLVRYWLQAHPEDRVINLDALSYSGCLSSLADVLDNPRHVFIQGDICDRQLLAKLFADYEIDGVIHLAAESHVDRSINGPDSFVQTNLVGTFALLETARLTWGDDLEDKRFHHVSTDEVYGSLGAAGFFTETSPYQPNSPYSATKAGSDHLVRAYYETYRLPVTITNCSNNYGPFQFPEKLIPLMITNALCNRPLPVYGDGLNIRDWLYVEDHCTAIDKVFHEGALGNVYNVGGNNEWKNIDIIHLICDILDERLGRNGADSTKGLITYVADRKGHDRRYAIDNTKITTELGWRPATTFEHGIHQTVHWYLDNKQWWEPLLQN